MFGRYVFDESSAQYANRVILVDRDHLDEKTHYTDTFRANGFEVIRYTDDLRFRIQYEEKWKSGKGKMALIAEAGAYLPYDIRTAARETALSLETLFPRLNADILRGWTETVSRRIRALDWDLLACAYRANYAAMQKEADTENFLRNTVYSRENILQTIRPLYQTLLDRVSSETGYRKWFSIAEEKAEIDVLCVRYQIDFDTAELNRLFCDYALLEYGKLSAEMDRDTPVLISRTMEYMRDHSERFVVIVMDGMSEFDWNILSESFWDISYEKSSAFAMIPTVTSVSRQCLLSNRLPCQLRNPWKQTYEEQEFIDAGIRMGYQKEQMGYKRGYDARFEDSVCCGAVIVNDVDDLVHGQTQGRAGMANALSVLAKAGKLAPLVKRFLSQGFDVYITADHGNTLRRGIGKLTGTGVETESRSHCMLVLHNFADKNRLCADSRFLEFPKYYLPKEYHYLICNVGISLDTNGQEVMTHGGISVDECIVPFIKVLAVNNHA